MLEAHKDQFERAPAVRQPALSQPQTSQISLSRYLSRC